MAFSPDGNLLATASEDKTVLLWELNIQGNLDKLMQQSCAWMQDDLHLSTSNPEVTQYCLTHRNPTPPKKTI